MTEPQFHFLLPFILAQIIVGEIDGTLTGRVQVYSFPNTLYDITLVNIEATFAESHAGTPEIKLYYVNSATLATGYYRMTILSPDCTTVDTTGAIKPILRANGKLPVTDPTASDITAQVDINTTIIQNTEYYFQAENDVDSGQIAFCAKIDYYDNNDQTLASDTSGIILELDFTSNWEIDGITGTRKSPGQTVHYVSFEYTTEAYFCDNNNQQVSPAPLYPGQSVQVCVRTPANSDVEVVALRSVTFKNSMVRRSTPWQFLFVLLSFFGDSIDSFGGVIVIYSSLPGSPSIHCCDRWSRRCNE